MGEHDAVAVTRKVYGRGWHDGFAAAQASEDGPMTPARADRLEASLNAVARRVLNVVPKSEPWTQHQMLAELMRTQTRIDPPVLLGCLGHLRSIGLVREPKPGTWQRVVTRDKPASPTSGAEPATPDAPPPPPAMPTPVQPPAAASASRSATTDATPAPLDRLAVVAQQMRAQAAALLTAATEIEAAALDFTEREQQARADGDQLRQLRDLISGIVLTGGKPRA